jgi:hypothetical protein
LRRATSRHSSGQLTSLKGFAMRLSEKSKIKGGLDDITKFG